MSENKVVKFKKRRSINIGIIVFLFLFIYIAINVYIFFTKEQLSIYEVHEGTTAVDNQIIGLILRNESVETSTEAGFITYYQREGARVAKNATVYSVDDNGQMLSVLTNGDVPITLSDKNNAQIKHDIETFQNSFSNDNYSTVYHFKEDAESTVLDILNNAVINNAQDLLEETGQTFSYNVVASKQSGIVSYYLDNFETVTPESVTTDMYNLENYKKTSLRATEMLPISSPVYKLISSEQWNLVLLLNEDQYTKLSGKDYVKFTVLDDGMEMTGKLSLMQKASDYYAVITLNKHISNYLSERFLEVELDFNTVEGLKIPNTAIIEKDFYLVPNEYFSMGAESTETGLIKEVYSENGEVSYTFVPTEVYFQDEAYAYVDALEFEAGTWIHSSTNSERYQLGQLNKLTGVYNVNQGYAVFRRIKVLYHNDEYSIIEKDTKYGLSAYDHIALDGTTAVDQAIIY